MCLWLRPLKFCDIMPLDAQTIRCPPEPSMSGVGHILLLPTTLRPVESAWHLVHRHRSRLWPPNGDTVPNCASSCGRGVHG